MRKCCRRAGQAALVEVKDLSVKFVSREATVKAVNGVSFEMAPGEVLCHHRRKSGSQQVGHHARADASAAQSATPLLSGSMQHRRLRHPRALTERQLTGECAARRSP